LGSALLEALPDLRGIGPSGRPDLHMEVLGHEDVAQDFETQGGPKFVQRLNQVPAKAWGVEKRRAAIGAGSKIMEMIKPVTMALAWHQEILHPAVAHMPETGMYAPPATDKTEDLTDELLDQFIKMWNSR
jgi:hypothetical protein